MTQTLFPFVASLPSTINLLLGIAMLLGGGYCLVEGAVGMARRLGQSTLLIGLTVVAFGTSAPELAFNLTAAVKGSTGLSFGNVVGSNIANIGLVLGLSSLVRPLVVHSRVVRRELPILLGITAVTIMLPGLPGSAAAGGDRAFTRFDGVILLGLFGLVSWQWIRGATADRSDPYAEEIREDTHMPSASLPALIALFVLGLVCLVAGADVAEIGATGVARALGVSDAVIGLTIVAFATSLPEIVTSVMAARKGHGDLAVGNVVGSNLFNLCLVLGVTCTAAPVPVPPFGGWDLLIMLALTLALLPISATNRGRIVVWEGVLLVVGYGAFLVFTVVR